MGDEKLYVGQEVRLREWNGDWRVIEVKHTPVPEGDIYFVKNLQSERELGVRVKDIEAVLWSPSSDTAASDSHAVETAPPV